MRGLERILSLIPKRDYIGFSVDREILSNLTKLSNLGLEVFHAVDVGAHTGTWTRNLLKVFPNSKVLLIEPQDEIRQQSVLDPSNENLVWVNSGAGPKEEFREFKIHSRSDSSSFALHEDIEFKSTASVRVRRVENLVTETWGAEVFPQIVKLDCEGWDLEVLEGLGELLSRVEIVFLEAGLTNRYFRNNVGLVTTELENKGFRLFDIATAAINPSTGFTWNSELAFVNSRIKKYDSIFKWNEL
jgi:FkbM family methyltransferase